MRHTKTLPRRAAALFLAVLLLLPTAYATAGDTKLQTTTQIVDGLTYQNTVSENGGSRVESFSFELSPDSPVKPILVQGDTTIYGAASINRAVSNAQAAGWHVLGGINTDFFSMSNGVPLGVVVENGIYKSSTAGENAMVIIDGKVSIVSSPRIATTLYNQTNGTSTQLVNFNKARYYLSGLDLLNKYFSTVSTRSDGAGWYVRMKTVPDPYTGLVPELTVNSTLTLEVMEVFQSDKSPAIGTDEYILTADERAGLAGVYESFQAGDVITLTTACSDPVLSKAQWAGGVGDIMVMDGAITDSANWVYAKDGRQPRTAMGIKPDGTLVLYAVDGRQSGYSVGLSERNLAEELLARGCTTAVNLDGGGSTSFSLWVPGKNGPAIVNKPSGGSARGCGTYLLLVTEQKGNGTPSWLVPEQDGQVVLAGSSLPLPQVKAVDAGLNPVSANLDGLAYSSLSGLGIVSGDCYTAGTQPGTDILVFTNGMLSGVSQIHVVSTLSDLTVTRAGSSAALTSLNVKPEEQVQLAVSGSYWSRTALRGFDGPVTCTVQGNAGTVDSNGLFTASRTPGSGSITVSAGGQSREIKVTITDIHQDVQPGDWAYDAVEYCYRKGITSGMSPTLFGRDATITRGDFMVMLYGAAGRPEVTAPCTFLDIDPNGYQYAALSWVQANRLASGTGDNQFSPNAEITREQAFTILYHFLPASGKQVPDASVSILDRFPDQDQIVPYARIPAATLAAQGVTLSSGSNLEPGRALTRAEMAVLLYGVLEFTPVTDVPTDPVDSGESEPPDVPDESSTPSDAVDSAGYKLALDQSSVTLASGGSVTLNAIILPGAEGAAVVWISSDPDTAPVSSTGVVTNLNPDPAEKTVTITAKWNDLSSSCDVVCQAAQRAGTVTGADTGLNVRSGPDTSYARAGALHNGDRVIVLGQQPGWYQILYRNLNGQAAIGYVSADYLTLD